MYNGHNYTFLMSKFLKKLKMLYTKSNENWLIFYEVIQQLKGDIIDMYLTDARCTFVMTCLLSVEHRL